MSKDEMSKPYDQFDDEAARRRVCLKHALRRAGLTWPPDALAAIDQVIARLKESEEMDALRAALARQAEFIAHAPELLQRLSLGEYLQAELDLASGADWLRGREAAAFNAGREEGMIQGFADCESLIVAMLTAMSDREAQQAGPASGEPNGTVRLARGARSLALREAALGVSLGQHRTDAYDEDAITTAHQQAATAGLRRRGGRNRAAALSPERRREIAVTASNAARAARERAKKGE